MCSTQNKLASDYTDYQVSKTSIKTINNLSILDDDDDETSCQVRFILVARWGISIFKITVANSTRHIHITVKYLLLVVGAREMRLGLKNQRKLFIIIQKEINGN